MNKFREKIKVIIFGTDTTAGKIFDIILIISIVLSVVTVLYDSIEYYSQTYGYFFNIAEWIFTILFTLEYLLRIYSIRKPLSYILSFFGIIDLLAVIPTYISYFFPGAQVFSVIRVLRVLRIFRILKLIQFMGEADLLKKAMIASRRKIFVFLFSVINIVIILGSIMYLVEGEAAGFDNIPRSIYWAIVTLTTVGYGDISPITNLGQAIAAIIMIMGYGLIAVPTGIVTSEITFATRVKRGQKCVVCNRDRIRRNAKFCSDCGSKLVKNN